LDNAPKGFARWLFHEDSLGVAHEKTVLALSTRQANDAPVFDQVMEVAKQDCQVAEVVADRGYDSNEIRAGWQAADSM
jgi:hypothetical protein